jgi:hypothetical protein
VVGELDGLHHHVGVHEGLAQRDVVAGEGLDHGDTAVPQVAAVGVAAGDHHGVVPVFEQPVHDVAADEAGAARDDDAHA